MALTIAWEGKGVIANCDGLSDSAGGTWSEVGGGSIEYAGDAYLTGSGCIAGAYSNKTGRQQYALSSALDFDTAGNEDNSSTRNFVINIPEDTISSTGGTPAYYLTESNIQEGYSKSMGRNWKLKFKSGGENHQLKLDSLEVGGKTAIHVLTKTWSNSFISSFFRS